MQLPAVAVAQSPCVAGGGTANKYLQQLQSPLMAFRISCLLLSLQTFRNIFSSPFSFFSPLSFPGSLFALALCCRHYSSSSNYTGRYNRASNVRSRPASALLQRPRSPLSRNALQCRKYRRWSVPFAPPALLVVQRSPWQRQMPRRPSGERRGRVGGRGGQGGRDECPDGGWVAREEEMEEVDG